jgi:CPA1 family monovalent cation:H+ antiporter
MIILVRPISVFFCMAGSRVGKAEQTFLAFLAPRGIVAAAVISVFALRIEGMAGGDAELLQDAAKLVPATFMVIVGTVAIYGLGAAWLARWLGLADSNPQGILFAGADPWIRNIALTLQEAGYSVLLVDTNYANVAAANMEGLTAHCKSVLSEFVHEDVNLAGIGKLFALTKNDAVNAMAAKEYAHMFGSKNVFRLSPADSGKGERAKVGHAAKGRELFSDDWSEQRLQAAFAKGQRAKITRMSDEFAFQDFKEQHASDVVVLMVIDKNGVIQVNTADFDLEPTNDQSVVALV